MSEVTFEQVPTGRTHQVQGTYVPITDENGDAETEWALCAIVDGHRVVLQTFSVGYVAHRVGLEHTAVETPAAADADASSSSSSSSSSSGEPPAEPTGDQPPA